MWNEIWDFVWENKGWFVVGIATLILVLKKYVYDYIKKKRFESQVPPPEQEVSPIREQPEYTPFFKDKTNNLSNLDNQIKKADIELLRISNEGKELELEGDQLERWHMEQGKKVVERQNSISARGQKINDEYSFYVNQLKGLKQLKEQQQVFLGKRGE